MNNPEGKRMVPEKLIKFLQELKKKYPNPKTIIEANPTLLGGEENLTSILINGVKYFIVSKNYVDSLMNGALKRAIVEELPTSNIDTNTIYMVLDEEATPGNVYNEYMYISNNWELIGDTSAQGLVLYQHTVLVSGNTAEANQIAELTFEFYSYDNEPITKNNIISFMTTEEKLSVSGDYVYDTTYTWATVYEFIYDSTQTASSARPLKFYYRKNGSLDAYTGTFLLKNDGTGAINVTDTVKIVQ